MNEDVLGGGFVVVLSPQPLFNNGRMYDIQQGQECVL